MVHWWLRSYKDTDYCIKHKDKSMTTTSASCSG